MMNGQGNNAAAYAAKLAMVDTLRSARDLESESVFAAVYTSDPSTIPPLTDLNPTTQVSHQGIGTSSADIHVAQLGLGSTTTGVNKDDFQHVDRLRGKILQLAQLDRSRPNPPLGSGLAKSLDRRLSRVKKARMAEARKEGIELKASVGRVDVLDSNQKGKRTNSSGGKSELKPLKKAKVPLSECKKMVTEGLLNQTHSLWTQYIQGLLRLNDPVTMKSLAFTMEQQAISFNFVAQESYSSSSSSLQPSVKPVVSDGIVEGESCSITMPNQLSAGAASSFSKADWIGATIYVADSTSKDMRGIQGIVLNETEQTLILGTPEWMDQPMEQSDFFSQLQSKPTKKRKKYPLVRCLPKRGTIFVTQIPLPPATSLKNSTMVIEMDLYGNHTMYTTPVRATKKIKARKTIEI